jgi:nucleoside-diphosphate-sugar epimerase
MSDDTTKGAVLVTGAAGLIGNAVRTKLEAMGRSVVPIDRVDYVEDGKQIVVCDLVDIHRLHAIAERHRIIGIIHLRCLFGANGCPRQSVFDGTGQHRRYSKHIGTRACSALIESGGFTWSGL